MSDAPGLIETLDKEKTNGSAFNGFSLSFASITWNRSCDYCVCLTGGTKCVVCVRAVCTVRGGLPCAFCTCKREPIFPASVSLSLSSSRSANDAVTFIRVRTHREAKSSEHNLLFFSFYFCVCASGTQFSLPLFIQFRSNAIILYYTLTVSKYMVWYGVELALRIDK